MADASMNLFPPSFGSLREAFGPLSAEVPPLVQEYPLTTVLDVLPGQHLASLMLACWLTVMRVNAGPPQTWLGADGGEVGPFTPQGLEVTLWADPKLAVVMDPLFQDLRNKR